MQKMKRSSKKVETGTRTSSDAAASEWLKVSLWAVRVRIVCWIHGECANERGVCLCAGDIVQPESISEHRTAEEGTEDEEHWVRIDEFIEALVELQPILQS